MRRWIGMMGVAPARSVDEEEDDDAAAAAAAAAEDVAADSDTDDDDGGGGKKLSWSSLSLMGLIIDGTNPAGS